jgi:hypothetical protein
MKLFATNPLSQPAQQHLKKVEQLGSDPVMPNRNQTALAEARLEAHLNQAQLRLLSARSKLTQKN